MLTFAILNFIINTNLNLYKMKKEEKSSVIRVLLGITLITSVLNSGCEKDNKYVSFAPPDSPWPKEVIRQASCPQGFEAVIPWAQTVHDTRKGTLESTVEVDYLRMWAVVNNQDVLICEDDYNVFDYESGWFGLYNRSPWFGNNDYHTQMPVEYSSSGYLILHPNTYPDNVWHWWVTEDPRPIVPEGSQRFWVEMRVRITGAALVQLGADFYRTPTAKPNHYNIVEWGLSNWFGESPDWKIITAGKAAQ